MLAIDAVQGCVCEQQHTAAIGNVEASVPAVYFSTGRARHYSGELRPEISPLGLSSFGGSMYGTTSTVSRSKHDFTNGQPRFWRLMSFLDAMLSMVATAQFGEMQLQRNQ